MESIGIFCCIQLAMFNMYFVNEIIQTREYTFSEKVALIGLVVSCPIFGIVAYLHLRGEKAAEQLPAYSPPPIYMELETARTSSELAA